MVKITIMIKCLDAAITSLYPAPDTQMGLL